MTDRLEEIIRQEIMRDGAITFARFMELALYHPTLGYYSGGGKGREPLGWGGDYFTSGDVHPLWGWAIARQLYQMWEFLERPERFDVVEPGAGRGLLARDVWHFAAECAPEWADALRYTLVDRTVPESALRQYRQEHLTAELRSINVPDSSVQIVSDLAESDLSPGFTGCIISNELVDALPTHILEKQGGVLAEVYVTIATADGRLIETLAKPSSLELAGYLDYYAIPWRDYPDGWRCEACLDASSWLCGVAACLGRGYVLTIDYGATAAQLYTADRHRGTLVAYRHHQMSDHPLAQPGRQDITAHVNFSALMEAMPMVDMDGIGLTTQAEFLVRIGIREEAERLASQLYPYADTERHTDRGQTDYLRRRTLLAAVATLLDPRGLGAFRVLVQQRNPPQTGQHLLGFS